MSYSFFSPKEYGGKWKMLQYYAKHFFSPMLISPYEEDGMAKVYICADEMMIRAERNPRTHQFQFVPEHYRMGGFLFGLPVYIDATPGLSGILHISMYSWDSMKPLYNWTQNFQVETHWGNVLGRQES